MSETQVSTDTPVEDVSDNLDAFSDDFFGRKPDEKPEGETTPPAAEQDTDPKAGEGTPETQEEADPELSDEVPPEPVKKKPTFQDRINELVRQREEEKRTSDARLAKLQEDFEAKLAALQPKTPAPKPAGEPTPADLNEDGTDKYPLGEFDPAYIRDLTRHTFATERAQAEEKAEKERQQYEVAAAQEALQATWNEKLTPFKEANPDFMDKGTALVDSLTNLDPGYSRYLTQLIMSMDNGPDVFYYLASNPEEAHTIANSGAQKATLALGRIEAKFIEANAQKQLAKPKVSKAPPPPPVQSRGSAAGIMPVEADTDDLDAFSKAFFSTKR